MSLAKRNSDQLGALFGSRQQAKTADDTRLIEVDFPLEQVSRDSVHEKNVRHGHISTLHIWPARRPLAACRAALIATLLPDPDDPDERKEIYRRLAGESVETERRVGSEAKQRRKETRGGILHWGRENGPDLAWFRARIREAHGGRAPKVLDPFAGGGAIPLEAMRLGCEATAIDINPVAWFILKCTLDYPHRLAGQTLPLPDFARADPEFMEALLKSRGFKGKALRQELAILGLDANGGGGEQLLNNKDRQLGDAHSQVDLAWQVRAWGRRVLARARVELAKRYPTFAEFQPLVPGGKPFEARPLALLAPDEAGNTDPAALNREFDSTYLDDPRNPRWVAKPTVTYLWARTVRCKGCRATLPLLKTAWLSKKQGKRVRLTMTPKADGTGVEFGVETGVPQADGNGAQRREQEKRLGAGTMSRSGARCPCCPTTMTMKDLRLEGRAGRLGAVMTAVVVDGPKGKEYRLPEQEEVITAEVSDDELDALYADIPFGLPEEPLPSKQALGFRIPLYGYDRWAKLFTSRQLLTLGTILRELRRCSEHMEDIPDARREAIIAFLALSVGRLADYSSALCFWLNSLEALGGTFSRFALPIVWDFAEVNPLANRSGNFIGAVEWIARVVVHLQDAAHGAPEATVALQSATEAQSAAFDLICTDPPYYDAIPYSDLMDFFHVWLRRALHGIAAKADWAFANSLGPKWDRSRNDGELIDDASRFGGDKALSKQNYEDGMARTFRTCHDALNPNGRMVVVFANKAPDAWETLVAALIRAGFVVTGSWPIRTERQNRQRAIGSAALASSVWLVCRKRPPARPGWDATVLAEMRENIARKLRAFWDAGIRGPDFVWAATGPALEAFSRHPVVKKANEPGATMQVSEFLREVRRMVVDFVVGRVLTGDGEEDTPSGLDDVTTYYLLHRGDFGLGNAPAGACILYALSCNLSDRELADRLGILARPGRGRAAGGDDQGGSDADAGGGGSDFKLVPWSRRTARGLGVEAPGERPVPLIDRVHKLMQLWSTGEEAKVNAFLDDHGLWRHALFARLLQALIELAPADTDERAILESLSNHIGVRAGRTKQRGLFRRVNP